MDIKVLLNFLTGENGISCISNKDTIVFVQGRFFISLHRKSFMVKKRDFYVANIFYGHGYINNINGIN